MLINPSQLLDWKQYQFFNRRIGKLTEYFVFPNVKLVLKDLYGMKPKVLSAAESDAIGARDVRGCESKLREQRVR